MGGLRSLSVFEETVQKKIISSMALQETEKVEGRDVTSAILLFDV